MPKVLLRGRPKVSVAQLRILLTALEKDPSMYNASDSDMIAYLNLQKWLDLSDELNDVTRGAMLNTQSWKYVLRYWSVNVKNAADIGTKARLTIHKKNPSLTLKEAKELCRLERRFYNFMKKEDAREIVDVTYTGNFGSDPPSTNSDIPTPDTGIKVKVQLINVLPSNSNDENACPDGPKKRTIVVKEDNPVDPADVTKKLKSIFNENLGQGEPQKQILENQLDRLQVVSRELEEHIATIQSRIHMIKDLWKHRCGDN